MQRQVDRGVSPVVGTVLLMAITVILAATAASFFIGIGEEKMDRGMPTVAVDHTFDVDGDGSHVLRISHASGEALDRERLRIAVSGAECSNLVDPNRRYTPKPLGVAESSLSAGSAMQLSGPTLCRDHDEQLDLSAAEVTVSWVNEDTSSSTTLWRWRGPSA